MTGEELYQLYVDAHAKCNCGVDNWDDLGDGQDIWNDMARELPVMPQREI
jgi:hypothetical protein